MAPYLCLSDTAVLRQLETPAVYHVPSDNLYEVDEAGFDFLLNCAEQGVSEGEAPDEDFVRYCMEEGILVQSADKPLQRRIPIRKSPIPSLRYLELQITNRCNLRCGHCYLGAARPVDLSLDHIRRVLQQFHDMQGLRVLVSGGEPLLHPDFRSINSLLRTFDLRVVLLSNGTLIDRGGAHELNVHEVQVSLDGMRAGHDALRGPGTFDRTLEAVQSLLECGKAVSVATVVHAANVEELPEMKAFLVGLGVSEWTVDAPCAVGRLAENPDLQVPAEVAGKLLANGFGGSLHDGTDGYLCGSHLLTVTADALACKCGYYADKPLGHLNEGLEILWNRMPHLRTDALTCVCPHLEICRGGCRFRAETAGDPHGKDPVKCAAFGVACR